MRKRNSLTASRPIIVRVGDLIPLIYVPMPRAREIISVQAVEEPGASGLVIEVRITNETISRGAASSYDVNPEVVDPADAIWSFWFSTNAVDNDFISDFRPASAVRLTRTGGTGVARVTILQSIRR